MSVSIVAEPKPSGAEPVDHAESSNAAVFQLASQAAESYRQLQAEPASISVVVPGSGSGSGSGSGGGVVDDSVRAAVVADLLPAASTARTKYRVGSVGDGIVTLV